MFKQATMQFDPSLKHFLLNTTQNSSKFKSKLKISQTTRISHADEETNSDEKYSKKTLQGDLKSRNPRTDSSIMHQWSQLSNERYKTKKNICRPSMIGKENSSISPSILTTNSK